MDFSSFWVKRAANEACGHSPLADCISERRLPVDDAARAPLSQFARSSADVRTELDAALAKLQDGADALTTLEALDDSAEREGQDAALAHAYADVLNGALLETLPPAARLEVLLKTAWLCAQQEGQEVSTLLAASRALELAPADERALAIAEPLLLEAEEYEELGQRYAFAAANAGSSARAKQLLERAVHLLPDVPAAAVAVRSLGERLAQLTRETEDALLAAVRGGGADAASALVKLGERWLSEGRAREGVDKLPTELGEFRSELALDVLERLFDHAEDAKRLEQVLRRRVNLERSALGRGRALEKLGRFQHESGRDEIAAMGVFLAAAQAYVEAGEPDDAERAYERLLDISPAHEGAAAELVSLRAKAGNFAGVADAFGAVLRADGSNGRAAELLLSLASDAQRASAAQEFAELAGHLLWRLSPPERELFERLLRTNPPLFSPQTPHDEA